MKITYVMKRFTTKSKQMIDYANAIIDSYLKQGYKLTLRQLYYQFVSRGYIVNTVRNYKNLGSVINDGRLAGLIDWEAIEDRTRNLESNSHWEDPSDILGACAKQFQIDKWKMQPHRIEVWIEKEALAGVFDKICKELDVPYLCCRGYTSQSEMWAAAMRLRAYNEIDKQKTHILHFGDHDPSGIDMTRDIIDRLRIFGANVELERMALNMDQVRKYNPPPNPAKEEDSRFDGYIREFGHESWELDALEPQVLSDLVRNAVYSLRNVRKWKAAVKAEDNYRASLLSASDRWDEVVEALGG
jgi:hypothetical protein